MRPGPASTEKAPTGKKKLRTARSAGRRRQAAAETTYRETEYIDWLSKNRIPVVVKLVDGEEARGWIEYFDRDVIRLTRTDASNLFIFKDRVKYLYEEPNPFTRKRGRL